MAPVKRQIDRRALFRVAHELLFRISNETVDYQAESVSTHFMNLEEEEGAVEAYANDPAYRQIIDDDIKAEDLSHIFAELHDLIEPLTLGQSPDEALQAALDKGFISDRAVQETLPHGLNYEFAEGGVPAIMQANASALMKDLLGTYRRELMIGYEDFPEEYEDCEEGGSNKRMEATTGIVDRFIGMLELPQPPSQSNNPRPAP